MVRYGIAAVLADVESVELVGEVADGAELLTMVDELRPDVVLTDLAMPSVDGVNAIRRSAPATPISRFWY